MALTILAALAGWQWWNAVGERAEAQRHAAVAQTERDLAKKQTKIAEAEKVRVENTRAAALFTLSRFLADRSREMLEGEKDPVTALLLALEAVRDGKSDDEAIRHRLHWGPAEVSLEAARRALQERVLLKGHQASVTSVAWSPDGSRLASGSQDKTVRLWERPAGVEEWHEISILKQPFTLSPNSGLSASSSLDATVRLWERPAAGGEWRETAILKGHDAHVTRFNQCHFPRSSPHVLGLCNRLFCMHN